jgi:dipeptidyl aminopeptidase/acylaminoacyl peptidase
MIYKIYFLQAVYAFSLNIMYRLFLATVYLLFVVTNANAEVSETPVAEKPVPIELYAALPNTSHVTLSPNGKMLALIAPFKGRNSLLIWDLSENGKRKVLQTGEYQPQWLVWKSDHRLIVSLKFFSLRDPQHATVDTRLISIDDKGENPVVLVKPEQFLTYTPQIQDKIVSLLPDDENHILIELPAIKRMLTLANPTSSVSQYGSIVNEIKYPEVVRVDINTGQLQTVLHPHGHVIGWQADANGNVRLGHSIKGSTQYYEVRNLNDNSWNTIQPITLNTGRDFQPIAFDETNPNYLYALSNHEGGNLGLYELDTKTDMFVKTLALSKDGNIQPITKNGRLFGYHLPNQINVVLVDKAYETDANIINRALADSRNSILDKSADGKRILFEVVKGNEPRSYWILDKTTNKNLIYSIAETYPDLDLAKIASSQSLSYKARDGLKIPAILTLPLDYKKDMPHTPIPFVVLPHGGPSSRDVIGFNYIVQFLANRGFGVLQPQFRGSTGYGAAFEAAGYGQWGRAMQDDVTDGTKWLIDQKLADPTRIAIAGTSYGG